VFDSPDFNVDMDIASFSIFLEIFNTYLLVSEFTWEKTEKVIDKQSLPKFIAFLKNLLLSSYFQSVNMGYKSAYFSFTFKAGSEILSTMYEINEETNYLNNKAFRAREDQLEMFKTTLAIVTELREEDVNQQIEVVKKLPFCYPFEMKYFLFNEIVRSIRERNFEGVYAGDGVEVRIRRDHFAKDSIEAMKQLKNNEKALRGRIKIVFIDQFGTYESGIDTGGILKEYLYDLGKCLLDPAYGLFIETKDRELDPNPESKAIVGPDHLVQFQCFGMVVGRAIYEEILLDSVFSKAMLRRMLGKANFFNHLMLYDIELYKQMKKVKDYQGDVKDLCLSFVATNSGTGEEIELIPNGSNIPVTNENKIKYIYTLTHYLLNVKTREQSKAFLLGINEVIPLPFLQMFTPTELQILISGETTEIDIEDLRRNATYNVVLSFTKGRSWARESYHQDVLANRESFACRRQGQASQVCHEL
jgi:hypothetical protein